MCRGPRGFITIWKEVIGPCAWLLHMVHVTKWLCREVCSQGSTFLACFFALFLFFPPSQLLSGGFLLLMFTETPAIKSTMSQSGFPIVAWIWPDTINDKWQWACWWVFGRALSPLGRGRAAKLKTLGWWVSNGAAADLEPLTGLTPQCHAPAHQLGGRPGGGTNRMVALSFLQPRWFFFT